MPICADCASTNTRCTALFCFKTCKRGDRLFVHCHVACPLDAVLREGKRLRVSFGLSIQP